MGEHWSSEWLVAWAFRRSRLRQLRDGGENDPDEVMKTPASQKMETPAPAGMISCRWHVTRVGQKISFTTGQFHYSRKILDTTVIN